MDKKVVCSLILILILSIPQGLTIAQPLECSEVPAQFEHWNLGDISSDGDKVIRWYRHPQLPSCRGASISLLVDCREYIIIRSVFMLSDNGEIASSHTLLRMEDDQWKSGRGVNMVFAIDVKSGQRFALFTLDSDNPVSREIALGGACN